MFRVVFLLNLALVMFSVLGVTKTPSLILAANATEDVKRTSSEDLSAEELKVDNFLAELNQIDQDTTAFSEAQGNEPIGTDDADDNAKECRKGIKLVKKKLREFPLNGSQEVVAEETQELPSEDIISKPRIERKIVKNVASFTTKPGNRSTEGKKAGDKTLTKNGAVTQIVIPNIDTTKKREPNVKSKQKVEEIPSAEIDENEVIEKLIPALIKDGKTDEIFEPREELEMIDEMVPLLRTIGKDKVTVSEEVEVDIEIGFKTYREIVIETKDKSSEKGRGEAEDAKTRVTESNMITVLKDQVAENPKEKGFAEENETELV